MSQFNKNSHTIILYLFYKPLAWYPCFALYKEHFLSRAVFFIKKKHTQLTNYLFQDSKCFYLFFFIIALLISFMLN